MAQRTILREACLGVIRIRCFLVRGQVTVGARRAQAGVNIINVAVGAGHRNMFAR